MTAHVLREQPPEDPGVSTDMGPEQIARSRLLDYAQGAHPELFSPADAVRVWNQLIDTEARLAGLRKAVGPLLQVLHQVDITADVSRVRALGRVLDNIEREMNGS